MSNPEDKIQSEINRLKAENDCIIAEINCLKAEINRLKAESERMRMVLDYVRRACRWTGSESMIVMSIQREVDRFDHEIHVRDTHDNA